MADADHGSETPRTVVQPGRDPGGRLAEAGHTVDRQPPVAFVRRRRAGSPDPRTISRQQGPLGSDPLADEHPHSAMQSAINRIVETLAEGRERDR